MKEQLLELAKKRRSIYALGRNINQTPDEIADLIKEDIKWAPTPFNNQTTRAVILFGQNHEKLWTSLANVSSQKFLLKRLTKRRCKRSTHSNRHLEQ